MNRCVIELTIVDDDKLVVYVGPKKWSFIEKNIITQCSLLLVNTTIVPLV